MNRSALFVLLATATATMGAQAHPFIDNARVIGIEPHYENVSVPRQECSSQWVSEAPPAGGRNYGGAVVGGVAGALLGNQIGRGHGREAATAVGAVLGAFTGDNITDGSRWERRPYEPAQREVTSCRTVSEVQSRAAGYRVDYEYRGQHFTTMMPDNPSPYVPVRVSVEPVVGR